MQCNSDGDGSGSESEEGEDEGARKKVRPYIPLDC